MLLNRVPLQGILTGEAVLRLAKNINKGESRPSCSAIGSSDTGDEHDEGNTRCHIKIGVFGPLSVLA